MVAGEHALDVDGVIAVAAEERMASKQKTMAIPSHGRLDFADVFKPTGVPAAATAVHVPTPPSEWPASRPESCTMYVPAPDPEMSYFTRRHAYAYISPDTAPGHANPEAFFRAVFRTLAPDLSQDLELQTPSYFSDVVVCFRTPEDREAAMRRQPFEVAGVTVKLVREGEMPNVTFTPMECLAHVALHRYPVEERTEEEIRGNCCHFGGVLEVDRACFTAPDLSTVFVVLNMEHPREIPRELRIRYSDGSRCVVPIEILRVWDRSESLDANGEHVPLFQPLPAAA
ncbi:unnamed protein product [Triticum turgidum subsp. durum]|uniref:Uncharacterized protein n=1 Tax=Triticum turgidum subsp. durum TaxID=4567 RepID=A0A9R0U2C2_TRITD|nr:unnamed protein product [Triticum turgidum subsp. durum]